MENVLGIVAEYNPLHNGHVYHIQNAKERAKAEYVVLIMTGNFTQRGNTSIVDKWEKTRMALKNGVDLVIELPTIYSISSAENFADGAIKILNELRFISHISFGMEEEDITLINNIASVMTNEPKEYKNYLKEALKEGDSYPKACEKALLKYLNDSKYENVLNGSNNILAIEYLKALKRQKSNIIPIGIKREKVFYNSNKIIDEFASSTGIRNLLLSKQIEEVIKVVPASTFNILYENIKEGTFTFDLKDLSKPIIYKFRNMTKEEIRELPDVSEGLENLIKESVEKTNNLVELINLIKNKRYTQTRIQRILLYGLLGISKKDMEMSKKTAPYIRVLGCNRQGKRLLSEIDRDKLITSVKDYENKNKNKSKNLKRMLEIDKNATNMYTIAFKENSKCNLDYKKPLITE